MVSVESFLDQKKKPTIYPVFISRAGCPFRCLYCTSSVGSGTIRRAQPEGLESILAEVFSRIREAKKKNLPGVIAFYGGTFTALEDSWIRAILDTALEGVKEGAFTGVRFSTRPDSWSEAVWKYLDNVPVELVEIGAQSLDDDVLRISRRGYRSRDVNVACARVRERKWKLGLQLMVGLPGEDRTCFERSVRRAVALRPDAVRLYPTLVFSGTVLEKWLQNGTYVPLSVEEAVEWCAWAKEIFDREGIQVLRMGLHPQTTEGPGTVVAGPRHPAFGYLVRVRQWRRRVDESIMQRNEIGDRLVLKVPRKRFSEVVGPKRKNVEHWKKRWGFDRVDVSMAENFGLETWRS